MANLMDLDPVRPLIDYVIGSRLRFPPNSRFRKKVSDSAE